MHFNFRHLAEWGYDILGLKTYSPSSCYSYIKYFPATRAIVVCAVSSRNQVTVFFMDDKEYRQFRDGKVSLSRDKSEQGKRGLFKEYATCEPVKIFEGGELNRRAKLKAYLDEAEALASTKMLVRGKLITMN